MTTSKRHAPEGDQGATRDRRSHGEDYPGGADAGTDEQRYAMPPSVPEQTDTPKPRRPRGGGRGDAEAAVRFGPEQDDE